LHFFLPILAAAMVVMTKINDMANADMHGVIATHHHEPQILPCFLLAQLAIPATPLCRERWCSEEQPEMPAGQGMKLHR